jgi:hypothetical protein
MPEHRGQQAVDRPARRRGAARLEELPAEVRQVGRPYIADGEVPEARPHRHRPGLPGVQAAGACLRVTPFRGEPDFDGLGDRLLLGAREALERPEGPRAGAAGGRVDDAALALLADQPLAAARGPLVLRVPAPLRDRRHGRESYHTRTYPRTYGGRDDR